MKKIAVTWCGILLVLWSGLVIAQSPQKGSGEMGVLNISMTGFHSDKGSAMIALCNSQEDYKKKDGWFDAAIAPIKGGTARWTFAEIPFGTYAVKVYHDENENGEHDTNPFGVPKEQYGFSNNARAIFGPPSFEKARFVIDKADITISIAVK